MRILYFLFIFFYGCSSGLSIRPGNCPGDVKLRNSKLKASQSVEFKWREYGVGKQLVNLSDILNEINGPECKSLDGISVTIESTGLDQIVSLIPFVSQWTLTLEWDESRTK